MRTWFRRRRAVGERQDLEEMLGNLVDNACKWAQARVSVEVTPERAELVLPAA
jgi:signal transduction histidine kinase